LRIEGKLSDFVEKQRAAVRAFEPAFADRGRAGETATLVTEKFRVDQARRNSAAVDAHDRTGRAARTLVNRTREHLLARTGLAKDEDRHVGGRDLVDAFHDI